MSEEKNWYDSQEPTNSGNNGSGFNGTQNGGYNNGGYNNGPYQYNYTQPQRKLDPEGTNRKLANVSFGFGIASLALLTTGVFSVMTGAFGMLMGMLSRRKGKGYPSRGKAGIIMSTIGLFVGLALSVYSVIIVLNDETYLNQINEMYKIMYGEELDWESLGLNSNSDSFDDYINSSNSIEK